MAGTFFFNFFFIFKLSVDFHLIWTKVRTSYIFYQLTFNDGWSILHPNNIVIYKFGISSHQRGSNIACPTHMINLPCVDIELPPLEAFNDHLNRAWGGATTNQQNSLLKSLCFHFQRSQR